MGSTHKQIFLKRRHTNDTQVAGKMFNTVNHREIQIKTSMRDHVTSVNTATTRETVVNTCWLRAQRRALLGTGVSAAIWKTLSTNQPDPVIPIPHARGCQEDTCNPITETLFSVAKQSKQQTGLPIND